VVRLDPGSEVPRWARGSSFASVTRTRHELSIVCDEAEVPASATRQGGFCGLRVSGPLDFSETGILASLADPLAKAGISIFAVSTYDTDYLFLPVARESEAHAALVRAGHTLQGVPTA
jgi:hypothetical protein